MREKNSFDSLRLIGSAIVMLGHAFIITGAAAPMVGNIPIHSFGVCIFFVISGYFITQSWLSDSHLVRYMIRRGLRIFPALIVVVTVTAMVVGPWATTEPLAEYFHHGWTYRYAVSNSLLITVWGLPGTFVGLPVTGQANGSLWTLPIEFGLYLITPLLLLFYRRTPRASILGVLCLALGVIAAKPAFPGVFNFNRLGVDIGHGLALAPYFWIGCALRLADFAEWSKKRSRWASSISATAVVTWAFSANHFPGLLVIAIIPISILILSLGMTKVLSSTAIEKLGDVSYGTYLWAFPVQQLVMLKLGGGPYFNLAIAGPLTLMLAYGSWHLIERPSLRFKPRAGQEFEKVGVEVSYAA
jgi:peptidoglycan/LPS O-acetylase OafA/YrhL